jgi:uncharacterized protein YyaL (SSP411 family)
MQHTNRLINSLSPYLLQHAHNPVDWFFWGEEALQKSVIENKPILVSIGYSSCHWCHVMERESFEDEATAEIMNKHFINIKIDREERPDLDHIYMDALQAMSGSGGWPLNVFLTPQLKPFYGGTYFPPIAAHGRMSWQDTLLAVSNAFANRKNEIETQAEQLTQHIASSSFFGKLHTENSIENNEEVLDVIAHNILKNADTLWGGFGKAPKFPQTFSIQFLLRHYHFTKDEKCLQQALLSIDKMILGGIYDQVGGGFARYSTDDKWFAPHFEKMLYDNALLVSVLSEAYQITNKEMYAVTIKQTLEFVEREMMSNEFAFYSALDADSEGVEGKFYTWSKNEIENILGNDTNLFCEIFQVAANGNWEHTNILWLSKTIEDIAIEKQIDINDLKTKIENWKQILLVYRANRIRPLLDDKTLCSWNCLMSIAYCKAFAATGLEHYKTIAVNNISFILNRMIVDDELMHCYKNSKAYVNGFLDDYAYLIWALIHLQEITGNQDYLLNAKRILEIVFEKFEDVNSPFFFYTSNNQKDTLVRKIDLYDGATPSANGILNLCLNYLSEVFRDAELRKRFLQMVVSLEPAIRKHPTSFGVWLSALQYYIKTGKEICVVGEGANAFITSISKYYMPNKIVLFSESKRSVQLPILLDKNYSSTVLFYLCQNNACLPVENRFAKFLHLCNI